MRYERDPGLGAHVTVTYAGPWLGPVGIVGHDPVPGWVEPCGAYDATELLEAHTGKPVGELFRDVVLPAISLSASEWWRGELLAYLNPIRDGRVTFTLVAPDAVLAGQHEPLPAREERADTVHRQGGPDFLDKLKEIQDLARVRLAPDDLLVVRVSDHFTPNQMREYQEYLRQVTDHPNVAVMIGDSFVLELDEPESAVARGKMTRIGGTWVHGWVTEAEARVRVTGMHKESLDSAKLGLKEAKELPVEWWDGDERLEEPPAEVVT